MIGARFEVYDNPGDKIFPDISFCPLDGTLEGVGIVRGGMSSGKPSVALVVKMPDGEMVHVQTSAAMFLTMAAGMKGAMAKWGEPWDGA